MRKMIPNLLTILTLPLSGVTLPHPSSDESLVPGGVYICSEPNWGGTCYKIASVLTTCLEVPTAYRNIESFGPDAGALCIIFK
jgi:hypothetical protein